jgi:beta-lactamase regulating signal transducer with metallopeptidase domain
MYIIANAFSKKWRIKHPKNKLMIYIIVLFTSFSIFPFATIAFSTTDFSPQIDLPLSDIKVTPISSSTIITDNQNITFASSITPILDSSCENMNGTTKYVQKITWNELTIFDKYQPQEVEQTNIETTTIVPLSTSQFLKKTLIAINKDNMTASELINHIITNLLIDQTTKQQSQPDALDESKENEEFSASTLLSLRSYYHYGILILFCISLCYIILSIYLGKNHTLKRLNAFQCQDPKILNIVSRISKEFNIKEPKIYQYDGSPNAFVFSYPTILAISTNLQNYLTDKEFEAALRHEIAHIKHHDPLVKPLLQGLRIFFFYNPLVHILCLKIMKNMELLADSQTYSSKKEKISLMEALIKISEYTTNNYHNSIPSYLIPLISYHSEKLSLTDRFSNLFEHTSKKTVITLFISAIILLTNASLFIAAGVLFQKDQSTSIISCEKQEFAIEESYYTESIKYTRIEKNANIYLARIVQRNLYNIISTKSSSCEIINDMIQQLFPEQYQCCMQVCTHDSF